MVREKLPLPVTPNPGWLAPIISAFEIAIWTFSHRNNSKIVV